MAKDGSGLAAPVWNARRPSLNSDAPWSTPEAAAARVLGIQRKLHKWASDDQDRRFTDLHNLVCDPATLQVAWLRVRANRGSRSAGVDGDTAYYVEHRLGVQPLLTELREELRSGSYRPLPVRERMIPKRDGKLRRLGIATIRDRVVQAAMKLVLEPIFEVDFAPCSYGFRPGRRAQDAIDAIRVAAKEGRRWIVDADIRAYFDSIDKAKLLAMVAERLSDRRMLAVLRSWLDSGVLDGETLLDPETGTPQGGVISPLLANLYLTVLDRAFEALGSRFRLVR